MLRPFLATSLFATLAAGAMAQPAPSISISDAWARATTSSTQAGAIYATITDHGAPDRLIASSTPVAGTAQLHETVRDGNVMKMRAVPSLAVSPTRPTSLAPGGYHIMLTQLKQPLTSGQTFPLTLTFEKAGAIQTTVTVKPLGASGGMNMGGAGQDMQHTNMPGMTKPGMTKP
jgi:copper(I)-binding protein